MLMNKGFRRVRPLQGGIEAWIAAGLPAVFHGTEPKDVETDTERTTA